MEPHGDRLEEVVSSLAASEASVLHGVITDVEPARSTPLARPAKPDAWHRAHILPLELNHYIAESLDLQSISRVTRVSAWCKASIERLPAYQALLQHAPEALAALGRTGLAPHVTVGAVYAALLADRCAYCAWRFGGFLFLPTCERVCFDCLRDDARLLLTTPAAAGHWLGLGAAQLRRLPALRSLCGTYGTKPPARVVWRRRLALVSARQAKVLALALHGSPERLDAYMASVAPCPDEGGNARTPRAVRVFNLLRRLPVGSDDGRALGPLPLDELDDFAGLAAIRLPALRLRRDGRRVAERGHLCRGCQVSFTSQWRSPMVQAEQRMARFLVDADGRSGAAAIDVPAALLALKTRLRTRTEFLDHVRRCYGARLMLSDADACLLEEAARGWGDEEEKEEEQEEGPVGARYGSARAVLATVAD